MEDILHKIIANKRIEVEAQKKILPFQSLSELVGKQSYQTQSMRASLAKSPFGIIAEFKRKSPSKGWLYPEAEVGDIVPAYEKGGASACSVLTDNDFFGGSLEDLQKARSLVNLPILRKDFIVDFIPSEYAFGFLEISDCPCGMAAPALRRTLLQKVKLQTAT